MHACVPAVACTLHLSCYHGCVSLLCSSAPHQSMKDNQTTCACCSLHLASEVWEDAHGRAIPLSSPVHNAKTINFVVECCVLPSPQAVSANAELETWCIQLTKDLAV